MCEDEDTTTLPEKCARRSVDVVAGVRIVKCHAIMDVVIDVRMWSVTQAYMSSLAFALCFVTHSYIFHFSGFSTSCPNSHLVVML